MTKQEDASLLRAVVETAVDGVILIDAQERVQMFNPACERLFGYAATDVIGQPVEMLIPSPFLQEHAQYLDHYRRTGEKKVIGRKVTGRRKNGSSFIMDLSVRE